MLQRKNNLNLRHENNGFFFRSRDQLNQFNFSLPSSHSNETDAQGHPIIFMLRKTLIRTIISQAEKYSNTQSHK